LNLGKTGIGPGDANTHRLGAVILASFLAYAGTIGWVEILSGQFEEAAMESKRVRDWMTANPIIISSNCTLPEAYWLMVNNKIRRLPVVDQDILVGIVTLEDLRGKVPAILIGMDPVRASDMLTKLPVRHVMSENPKTIAAEATLVEAARLMLKFKISTLPVMDGTRLAGIITESDIFRALVKQIDS